MKKHLIGVAGGGGLIRDTNGKSSSFLAELWALRDGLQLCLQIQAQAVIIDLDSKTIVDAFNSQAYSNTIVSSTMDDCMHMVTRIPQTRVRHIYREANRCADYLVTVGEIIRLIWLVFGRVETEIKEKKAHLQILQDSINSVEDAKAEKALRMEIETLLDREELILREGQWRVGTGFNIPLTHQNWFPSSHGNLHHPELQTGTVGDLIDHNSKTWKADLVRTLYHFPLSKQILQVPLPKTHDVQDKLMWKYSNEANGNYKVKRAYEIIMQDSHSSWNIHRHQNVWNLIWGVKVPLKINTFVWKLIQDRLPTLLNLNNRGIPIQTACPLCNSDVESSTHLFLLCPFTRACWHGLTLAVHFTDFSSFKCPAMAFLTSHQIQIQGDFFNGLLTSNFDNSLAYLVTQEQGAL
ncbi:hypothetical protein SO802_026659 [Lithocarpus litseifolius]|uniref:Reverse transcriptase zinc-binding domain-containing protein n=1 Tax=Lithocarpus litseifolius TaxID=425828 RepID=A0AAW2C0D6_9ROSI